MSKIIIRIADSFEDGIENAMGGKYNRSIEGLSTEKLADLSNKFIYLGINTSENLVRLLLEQDIIAWDIWDLRPADVPVSHLF